MKFVDDDDDEQANVTWAKFFNIHACVAVDFVKSL